MSEVELFRLTYEQERRFCTALGISWSPGVHPSGEAVSAAAETLRRDLEQSREQVRALESGARSFEAKSRELEGLRTELTELRQDLKSRYRLDQARGEIEAEDARDDAVERARIAGFLKVDPSRVI